MEHSTVKKILIGLFFCVVLFVASFFVGKNQEDLKDKNKKSSTEEVTSGDDVAM